MKISQTGLNLIKSFESLRTVAHPDPGTGGAPWTIGWRHTQGVTPGLSCTLEQAEQWLQEDLEEAESAVNKAVLVEMRQQQFDALVSFVFDIGVGAFRNSRLLKLLNNEQQGDAAEQFKLWTHAGGRVLARLVRRRAVEAELFTS